MTSQPLWQDSAERTENSADNSKNLEVSPEEPEEPAAELLAATVQPARGTFSVGMASEAFVLGIRHKSSTHLQNRRAWELGAPLQKA